jgi:hypothetical protein
VRSGEWKGVTGKPIKNIVAIGIGGSFLGPLFVHTALRTEPQAMAQAKGRQLRFLANVDPIDVARALNVSVGRCAMCAGRGKPEVGVRGGLWVRQLRIGLMWRAP